MAVSAAQSPRRVTIGGGREGEGGEEGEGGKERG